MKFKNSMGIDPIVHPLIGYIPTLTDQLKFLNQIETIQKNIAKYWPEDNSWDQYEVDDITDNIQQITFKEEEEKEEKHTFSDKYNINKILDDYDIVLTRTK